MKISIGRYGVTTWTCEYCTTTGNQIYKSNRKIGDVLVCESCRKDLTVTEVNLIPFNEVDLWPSFWDGVF